MGRNKYSNRDASRRNKGNKGKSNLERKLLLNYLQEYQERSFSLYYSTTATATATTSSSSRRQDDDNNIINRQQPIKIGGVCLPKLDNDTIIMEQPFLALPRELSPKQRAMVHDICVDNLKLFHCGVDDEENEGERYVVVSIYSDGFTHVPGLNDIIIANNKECYLPIEEVGKYKPWIMLKNNNNINQSSLKTKEGEIMIRRMIDQPGRCFRDGDVDMIDLIKTENDDLSTIIPPKQQDDDDNNVQVCLRVDTVQLMQQCIKELKENKPTEIGFDLECYNKSRNYQITCLIQLATNDGREYIIDVLGDNGKVWDTVGGLANIFADKSIVKIGHGINGLDIQSLQRDFGIFVVNVFDTYEAAVVLGLKEKGLAKVCAYYGLSNCEFYNTLKSTYQKTNWAKRPLTEPMILYSRYDVHYLIQLRKLMIRDLIKSEVVDNIAMDDDCFEKKKASKQPEPSMTLPSVLGDNIIRILNEEDGITENDAADDDTDDVGTDGIKMQLTTHNEEKIIHCTEKTKKTIFHAKELRMNLRLMEAVTKSQYHCLNFWNMKPEPYLKNKKFLLLTTQCKKDGKEWSKSQLDLYVKLVSWREDIAKKEESLPGVICSLDFLVMVALLDRPITEFGLRRIRYDIPYILIRYDDKRYMKTMLELVKNSRTEDDIEICELYPTYEDFKERITNDRMQKSQSLQKRSSSSSSSDRIANWVFWTVTSAAISVVIYVSISKIKGKR